MNTLNSYKKKDLRAYYKRLRAAFTQEQAREMDQQIMQQFHKLPLSGKGFKYALVYIPMAHVREVDTRPVIHYLEQQTDPALQIAFPKTDFSNLCMEAVLPDSTAVFKTGTMKLTEPDQGRTIAPEAVDLLLLPLLIFDQKGNRVGYGKGFYDRFLARCRPDVLKIGLSYLPPVTQIEDVNAFDIPLNYCVTPDRLYDFQNQ